MQYLVSTGSTYVTTSTIVTYPIPLRETDRSCLLRHNFRMEMCSNHGQCEEVCYHAVVNLGHIFEYCSNRGRETGRGLCRGVYLRSLHTGILYQLVEFPDHIAKSRISGLGRPDPVKTELAADSNLCVTVRRVTTSRGACIVHLCIARVARTSCRPSVQGAVRLYEKLSSEG